MVTCRALGFLLISSSLAIAQVDSNSVTVTAYRTTPVPADQAIYDVSVTAPLATSIDDVLAVVRPAGIGVANFINVYTIQSSDNTTLLQWKFTLTASLTNTTATVATLANLQSTVAKNSPGFAVMFSLQGTTASPQALRSLSCSLPDLLNDVKAKAQTMATAAGRFVSGLVALATNVSTPPGVACSVTAKYSLVGF
jgi:hypothetical protein